MFDLANCNLEEQGVGIWETTNLIIWTSKEWNRLGQNRIKG